MQTAQHYADYQNSIASALTRWFAATGNRHYSLQICGHNVNIIQFSSQYQLVIPDLDYDRTVADLSSVARQLLHINATVSDSMATLPDPDNLLRDIEHDAVLAENIRTIIHALIQWSENMGDTPLCLSHEGVLVEICPRGSRRFLLRVQGKDVSELPADYMAEQLLSTEPLPTDIAEPLDAAMIALTVEKDLRNPDLVTRKQKLAENASLFANIPGQTWELGRTVQQIVFKNWTPISHRISYDDYVGYLLPSIISMDPEQARHALRVVNNYDRFVSEYREIFGQTPRIADGRNPGP